MRITKAQYEKAKATLPKLQKAQEIVTAWDKAVAGEKREVTSIKQTAFGWELSWLKETERVKDAAA